MASKFSSNLDSNSQLLQELEELSQTLYPDTTNPRRNASLSGSRASLTSLADFRSNSKSPSIPKARRMSLSPWLSTSMTDDEEQSHSKRQEGINHFFSSPDASKKGIWNWKPIRKLSLIGMQKISCLFSVEVISVSGLPPSMDGLRLAVCVRKKETKEGSVHTMPARVTQGEADFDEMLFFRCNLYCKPENKKSSAIPRFEPRPFWIYVFAIDATELELGRSSVDLSRLIHESISKSQQGTRVRQWDAKLNLSGKATGGELIIKLGFQIMEEGAVEIYSDKRSGTASSSRKSSKSSFSVRSPRIPIEPWVPSHAKSMVDRTAADQQSDEGAVSVEEDVPDFVVVDKGVEKPTSKEVVKEVVRLTRLTELDSIAQQIHALEAMMKAEKNPSESLRLDADEESVTKDFLQMLEKEGAVSQSRRLRLESNASSVSALGEGLGCVIQTKSGGFLASMDPFDAGAGKADTPKLAMQLSKPVVVGLDGYANEFELFQALAASDADEVASAMPMEELAGKTAEQIAFEGIASAIIQGRNKEGATSRAARSIAAVRAMSAAMSGGRKERVTTGIWSTNDKPISLDHVLPFAMQKMEAMVMEALKIQAEAGEDAPFSVSAKTRVGGSLLEGAVSMDEVGGGWERVGVMVGVQARDPVRQYEAVGGRVVAVVSAKRESGGYRATSVHLGGTIGGRGKVTSMQWLGTNGFVKGRRSRVDVDSKEDLWWSLSSRIVAGMWLKISRNPDVTFAPTPPP